MLRGVEKRCKKGGTKRVALPCTTKRGLINDKYVCYTMDGKDDGCAKPMGDEWAMTMGAQ